VVLNSSDNLHSYPPDNHHSSDDVCWREGEISKKTGADLQLMKSCDWARQ